MGILAALRRHRLCCHQQTRRANTGSFCGPHRLSGPAHARLGYPRMDTQNPRDWHATDVRQSSTLRGVGRANRSVISVPRPLPHRPHLDGSRTPLHLCPRAVRTRVPEQPRVRHTTYIITAIWALAFFVMIMAELALLYVPGLPRRIGVIAIILALVGAVKFTRWYPEQASRPSDRLHVRFSEAVGVTRAP